ncbi:MAG: hypothetical protein ABSG21_10365 [Spirochaetia bacterium]|jgi:hypothetical protein
MSRLIKVVSLMLLVFLAAGNLFAQTTQPKAAWPAYVLCIFPGYGFGHYYLGQNGTPFLLGDLIGAGVALAGMGLIASAFSPGSVLSIDIFLVFFPYGPPPEIVVDSSEFRTGCALLIAGGVVLLVSRIWEFIDVFAAVDRARAAGKVAVVPVFNVQRTSYKPGVSTITSYDLGVSLQY